METIQHHTFLRKVRNFPEEVYDFKEGDHLTNLMKALLEDPGVGGLRKTQTVWRLSETLSGTQYSDLDVFFGYFFHITRFPEEQYSYDPFTDQLTTEEWNEVNTKDSRYRERIRLFLSSFQFGGTIQGLRMVAEAACGYPCLVIENWRYIDDEGVSGDPGRLDTPSVKEVTIIPKTDSLPRTRIKSIYRATRRLKPVNVLLTVDPDGIQVHTEVQIRQASSPSEYFEVVKQVTGVNVPTAPDSEQYMFLEEGVEVPGVTPAMSSTQETRYSLRSAIAGVTTFSLNEGSYDALPAKINVESPHWGQWREVETADSPDNYPEGKYPGVMSRYDSNGDYMFPWASQSEYETSLDETIEALGGERVGGRWRIPLVPSTSGSVTGTPWDSLSPITDQVLTTWYTQ